MRKKLQQYMGLVDTAENNSGERKTTAEDLQVCLNGGCVWFTSYWPSPTDPSPQDLCSLPVLTSRD